MREKLKDAYKVGKIENYYGGLQVFAIKADDGVEKYSWGIGDWDGTEEESIPKYLFDALMKFKEEGERNV